MQAIPERFIIAAEILASAPHFNILEIGCGTGILAGLLAASLNTGRVVAIDRSSAMISSAIKNCQKKKLEERIDFIHGDFLSIDLPAKHFDRIIAFNVPFFRKDSRAELEKIKNLLNPDGIVLICYQAPHHITLSDADEVIAAISKSGFILKSLKLHQFDPFPAWYLVAQPANDLV